MPIKSIKGLVFYKQPFCAFWFYVQGDFNKANAFLGHSLLKKKKKPKTKQQQQIKHPKPLSFFSFLLETAT